MGTPPIPEDKLLEAIQLVEEYGTVYQAAKAKGIPRGTLKNRYERAQQAIARGEFGDGIVPGFALTSVTTDEDAEGNVTRRHIRQAPSRRTTDIPEGLEINGLSRYEDGQGGTIGQWFKYTKGKPDPLKVAEYFKESLQDYKPKVPLIPKPKATEKGTLATYFLADWHVGLAAKNWGLEQSRTVLTGTLAEIVAAQHNSQHALVVVGGDFYHIDNWDAVTPRSKNPQDASGTMKEVLNAGRDIALDVANLALQKHEKVDFLVIPGNHDLVTSHALRNFLYGRFYNEPRINILEDEHGYHCHTFGKVMQFFHHGHDLKIKEFPGRMAALYPGQWGETEYRYAHSFHWHHKERLVDEHNGVITEIHQAPSPKDEWGKGKAFISLQAMQSILFHEDEGEWFRVTRPIRKWT